MIVSNAAGKVVLREESRVVISDPTQLGLWEYCECGGKWRNGGLKCEIEHMSDIDTSCIKWLDRKSLIFGEQIGATKREDLVGARVVYGLSVIASITFAIVDFTGGC